MPIAPESRVVYVDNDPVVLAHARALLVNTTPEGVTSYVEADYHDAELIISDARNVLNFNEPIAVMFKGLDSRWWMQACELLAHPLHPPHMR